MTEKNRRILLAWELGAGLGHIRRLLVLARALKQQGWEPIIGQRNIHTVADEVAAAGFQQFQNPRQRFLTPAGQRFHAYTFADILGVTGFARRGALVPLVQVWDTMLDLIRPAVIVGDYSPILPLAARGRYPFIAFGDGFVVPPPLKQPFQPLRQHGAPTFDAAAMLAMVQDLLQERGQPAIESLAELVAGDQQAVITLQELDVYGAIRQVPALGPLDEPPPMMALPEGQPVRLFAYLAADYRDTRKVLQAIADSKVPAEAFVRDAPEDLKNALRQRGVKIYDQPPPLAEVLKDASGIIHHGGVGTLETALCIGRPQLLVPRHLEQRLNARNLADKGLARILPVQDMPKMIRFIQGFSADSQLSRNVAEKAAQLNHQRPLSSLGRTLALIEEML